MPVQQWKAMRHGENASMVEYGNMATLEGCLTLRTQLRQGELQASWSSLEVGRSPVHIIFQPHHSIPGPTFCLVKRAYNAPNVSWGGLCILGCLGKIGVLEVPPQQIPPFPRVKNANQVIHRDFHCPLVENVEKWITSGKTGTDPANASNACRSWQLLALVT